MDLDAMGRKHRLNHLGLEIEQENLSLQSFDVQGFLKSPDVVCGLTGNFSSFI